MAQALPELHRRCCGQFGRSGASQHHGKHRRGDTHKSFSPPKEGLFQGAVSAPRVGRESTGGHVPKKLRSFWMEILRDNKMIKDPARFTFEAVMG
jgi:hypothetical protein